MPALFDRQQIYDRFLKPQVRHKNWPTHCTAPIVNTAGRPFPLSPYWVCGPPPLKSPCFPPLVSGGLKRCRAVYLRRVHHGALRAKPPRQTPPAHAFSVCRQAADVNKHSWVYGLPIHFSIHFTPDKSGDGFFPLSLNVRTQ